MSGSSHSNDNMSSGRVNRAEDLTSFWALRSEDADFNGNEVVNVSVEQFEDFDCEDGEVCGSGLPNHNINGIFATGFSGRDSIGGVGVIGKGGKNQGTGILGEGGGSESHGRSWWNWCPWRWWFHTIAYLSKR